MRAVGGKTATAAAGAGILSKDGSVAMGPNAGGPAGWVGRESQLPAGRYARGCLVLSYGYPSASVLLTSV